MVMIKDRTYFGMIDSILSHMHAYLHTTCWKMRNNTLSAQNIHIRTPTHAWLLEN